MALAGLSLFTLRPVRSRFSFAPETWAWLVLGGLLTASALVSVQPVSAFYRAWVFWVPATAGLACARSLLQAQNLRRVFFGYATVLFTGLSLLHLVWGPDALGLHSHALAGVLVLLSSGPVYLLLAGGHRRALLAAVLLALGYLVCFLAGSRFLVLLPLVLIPLFAGQGRISRRVALAALATSLFLGLFYFRMYPSEIPHLKNYESVFYRLEGYPAAWEILRQKPLLGIGIRVPRVEYLKSFEPFWGIVTAPVYLQVVQRNITFDNQLLSLLVETGVPATLLYLGLLAYLFRRYRGNVRKGLLDGPSEGALTFALLASLIHFLVCDGLYFPQTNWFFHVMLGLAAGAATDCPGEGAFLNTETMKP